MPGSSGRRNQFQKIIRLEEMPNDMSRFRLGPSDRRQVPRRNPNSPIAWRVIARGGAL